jgi:hypothetical protein
MGGGNGGVCDGAGDQYDNACQVCALEQCCLNYEACLGSVECSCWFDCIATQSYGDCASMCGGSPEDMDLNGCMHSDCNDVCVQD